MPLFGFGKKKSPEEQIKETRAKLREIVSQKVAGKITTEQMKERFYVTMRDEFPLSHLANQTVALYMLDNAELGLEEKMWYVSAYQEAIRRL